jgi:DNA-binding transcriptional LysR family regulator
MLPACRAERVLHDLELSMRVHEIADRRRGQVIVSSLIPVGISEVVAEYSQRFPSIEIHVREGCQDNVRDDVRRGVADFGIGYLSDLPSSHIIERLGVEVLCVLLRRDHPLARSRRIEFKSLRARGFST